MKLFDVYPRFDITLRKAKGVHLWDDKNQKYLDLYGGHGVISIGHNRSYYNSLIKSQLQKIAFYSNSVNMPLQDALAQKLAKVSGYEKHLLFLCNSGAEANENALKLAAFQTRNRKVIAFKGSFHGRTSAALNVTDNRKLSSVLNLNNFPVEFIEMNNEEKLLELLNLGGVAAVIIEGIQGVGGLDAPTDAYLQFLSKECKNAGVLLILDEIQSGYGRSGAFFAHQHADIEADIITMAKGMGNGFPVAGLLIHPKIESWHGMLGTTFGGNHLACAAALAVLEVMENEKLTKNATKQEKYLIKSLADIAQIKQIKGKGLMLGLEFDFPIKKLRSDLLFEHHIFTGGSSNPNLLRILPPLSITKEELATLPIALKKALKQ